MAEKKSQPRKSKGQRRNLDITPSSPFVSFTLSGQLLEKFGKTDSEIDQILTAKQSRLLQARHEDARIAAQAAANQTQPPAQALPKEPTAEPETEQEEPDMKTRGAWDKNLANPANRLLSPTTPPASAARNGNGNAVSASPAVTPGRANRQPTPRNALSNGRVQKSGAGKQRKRPTNKKKSVAFQRGVDVAFTDADLSDEAEELNDGTDKENEYDTTNSDSPPSSDNQMAEPDRPKLKLKMSGLGGAGATPAMQPLQTPVPQSAGQRIKLSFGRKPSIIAEAPIKKEESPEPTSASKKRKRDPTAVEMDDDPPMRKPSMPRKLTLKTKGPPAPTPASAITPHVKFHVKGKAPPRRLGVGYDSENEDTERDPVILEGFILRMQPGPDCDYVQQSITNGTIGLSKLHGGANVTIRMLDTHGRRSILSVRNKLYAATLVDLPCIVEGMKSWDRKGFVKSIDICQMLLVLGPCRNDEEARNYPLPDDVNPANYQYAHGITPPMHYVRKRRFEKTKRTRVDDIEAVERRVNALLADDAKAADSSYEILDYDPRDDFSATEEESEDEDEDADGELEGDDYFGAHAEQGGNVETPVYPETPQQMEDDEDDVGIDMDEFARMVEAEQHHEENATQSQANGLHPPPAEDSSFAVTSTSASPSASATVTAAQTPASAAGATSDDEGDDDDDADDDEKSESGKEDDENLQQTKDRIAELEEKIREQKEILKKTQNAILRRKIATKIGELEKDVGMMRRGIGLGDGEGDEEGE